MNWIENILIIAGISFDIFATMEIEGAMLADVKRKPLIIACALVTILQMGFFFGGYITCYKVEEYGLLSDAQNVGYIVATVVFALLGARLLVKAIKREFVNEKRRDSIRVAEYIRIVTITSLYTLVAGCACGFVGTSVVMMALVILVCSVLVVIGGMYTGYHYGFELKTGAYVIGAILLWIAGAGILLQRVLHIL